MKGIGLFAVGGGKLVAELAGLGLEVVADAAGDEPFKKDPGTYAAAIDALRATLESLNAQVFHEEQLIDQNFIRNLANIRNDKSSYDLSQPPISSSRGVIIINPSLVDEIITQVMPDIASELEAAAKQASALSTYQAVVRDGRIGLGASGPSDRFSEMAWLLYELLQDLAWEVRNGAKNLELAVGDLEHHNKRSAAQLSEFAEKIKAGSSYNPWD